MAASESSRVMRWIVLLALSAATALMYLISLRGNYLYGYGLGQTPEKSELFAWANVAADIWKGFGLVAVVLLWSAHKRIALLASLAWLVCLATGVNSAIGVYVQDRATLTGTRDAAHTSYADARKELGDVEKRIRVLGQQRSMPQVEAAIAARFATPVMISERVRGTVGSISNSCTKHDARTAEACAEVAALRQELAAAHDAARLEVEAKELRGRVEDLRGRGGALSPDPVGEFWTWATRGLLTVRDVGFGFPLAFALLIEIVSAFGPAVIVSVAAATRGEHGVTQPAAARSIMREQAGTAETGLVVKWLGDRTEPTSAPAGISLHELHADYVAWCSSHDAEVSARQVFGDEFDRVRRLPELADRIRRFGDRYYGLRLVRAPMLLPRSVGA